MMSFIVLLALVVLFAVYYSFRLSGGYEWIKGNGHVVGVSEDVDSFSQLHVHHGFEVDIREGDSTSVTMSLDENLVPYLDVYTELECLHIGLKKDVVIKGGTLHATVFVKDLNLLKGSGAVIVSVDEKALSRRKFTARLSGASMLKGCIDTEEVSIINSGASGSDLKLTASKLTLNVQGASDFKIAGSADDLDLTVGGASSIRGKNFGASRAKLDLKGASSVKIGVRSHIDISAAGGSDISILGNPQKGLYDLSGTCSVKFKG